MKVSVVMTVHNGEEWIGGTLNALLDQRGVEFEVVVVDDGSSDSTCSILQKVRDARVMVIQCGRLGRARCLNLAIAGSAGEYIAINDVDDYSMPGRLEIQSSFLDNHPEYALVCSNSCVRAGSGPAHSEPREVREPGTFRDLGIRELYRSNIITHSTVMVRRASLMQAGGYDEALTMCIDYEFYLRLVQRRGRIAMLSGELLIRIHNQKSFFARKKITEYITTLLRIKREYLGRSVPVWYFGYDVLFILKLLAKKCGLQRWRPVSGLPSRRMESNHNWPGRRKAS